MRKVEPLCITISDLHLSHKKPLARGPERDWYAVMERQLRELCEIKKSLGNIPIIAAGDIFDTYNEIPELVNWCFEHFPFMYAIPGQHDLPYHNYDHSHRSSYGILSNAGMLCDLPPGRPFKVPDSEYQIYLHAFPWGVKVTPLEEETFRDSFHIAIIHKYIWKKGFGYTGAATANRVTALKKQVTGYDFAVFGDNHQGFQTGTIVNNGTFIRRKKNDIAKMPCYSVLYTDGSIQRHEFKSAELDLFLTPKELEFTNIDVNIKEFTKTLTSLESQSLDYKEAIVRYCDTNQVEIPIKNVLLDALEGK